MAISTIGTDALAASAVTSTKLASGVPSRSQLPAGTVLQVVSASSNTNLSTSSSSFVASNIAATITPTSSTSKILVLASVQANGNTAGSQASVTIFRNSTNLAVTGAAPANTNFAQAYSSAGTLQAPTALSALDSPATTSATTYTIYTASTNGGGIQLNQNNNTSTITLMEIAA